MYAQNLPRNISANSFVKYQFKFDKGNVYQTDEINISGDIHCWNYSRIHCIDEITPQIVQELKQGSISFQVYAYQPISSWFNNASDDNSMDRRFSNLSQQEQAFEESRILGLTDPMSINTHSQ